MAKITNNTKKIVVVQFLHLLVFAFSFSVLLSVFSNHHGAFALFFLWSWMIPLFILEFLFIVKFKATQSDAALPLVSIVVLLLPLILPKLLPIPFESLNTPVFVSATIITVFNFYLLLKNFKLANEIDSKSA